MGLVVSREDGESITILTEPPIVVTIKEVRGDRVRVQIDAPKDIGIVRTEIIGRRDYDPVTR